MNTRALTLALIIAVFAMFMVYTYIDDEKTKIIKKYGKEQSVVIAKVDIKELELIDDSKVTVTSMPSNFVHEKAFKTIKEIQNTVATVPILKGEQITKPRVSWPDERSGLSRQVAVGKRAISLDVSERASVGKLIKPGDRVDILAGIDYAGGRKDLQKMKTILQDVLILSTGKSISGNLPIIGVKTPRVIKQMKLNTYSDYGTVTLELDPYEVQKLVFILSYNSGTPPYLALRNNTDKEVVRIKSTKLFDILGEDASEAKIFFSEKYKSQGN
ncbi:Flp pilus assembly protein CpaB [Halobacteriovorax sp. JY17]|uniref:Flp pilus assembly protein CpaB n=1 Tax=Halobacteriovorax sp. JY17 TaxID=2014617 RepID=UPI000C4FA8A1|nr:Flp pilus assembly protein CpaB [Halobacteriovorax sp. JY17]PIK14525.1 MAG: Flp pilus assembly protein CpaB [Halobacteriovorax sp. JY17]